MKVPPLTVGQLELLLEVCRHPEMTFADPDLRELESRKLIQRIGAPVPLIRWKITQAGSRLIDQMKALTTVAG